MLKFNKIILIFIQIVGLGLILSASTPFDKIEKIDYRKFSAEHPYISIHFKVFNHNHQFIKDLKKSQIQLRVNNIYRDDFELRRSFSSDEWLAVMMVVDKSGSMKGQAMIDEKKALKTFARNLGIFDKIALLEFNEKPELTLDFSRDKDMFISRAEDIAARGNTSLYDALDLAIVHLKDMLAPRKAIVVVSDGKDTRSKMKFPEVLGKVEKLKIPIFTIGLGNSNRNILSQLALVSAGKYFHSPSSDDLLDIYFQIGEKLKNNYVVHNLKLYNIEDSELYRVEITNLITDKNIVYNFIPINKTLGTSGKRTNSALQFGRQLFNLKTMKQVVAGRNKFITLGLMFFIILIVIFFWVFFTKQFLVIKLMITFLLLAFFIIIQYIIFFISG